MPEDWTFSIHMPEQEPPQETQKASNFKQLNLKEFAPFVQVCADTTSICPKSVCNASKLLKMQLTKRKIKYFNLQQAFKISSLTKISSASLRQGFARYRPPDFSVYAQSCRIFKFLNLLKIHPLHHLAFF